MDKKLVKPISLILAAVLLFSLLMGSMAYFSDTAKTQTSGKAGTVAISVDSNINLLDAEGRDILNPGDKRDAGFTVTNEGNKSVDVRTTMALTVQSNVEGNTLTFTGDADNQSEYDLYLADDVELVEGEGYKPKKVADANGKNPGDEGYVDTFAKPLQVKSINNDVITYILPEYVLNGNSDKYTEYETVDGVTGYSRTFDYVFVMKGETGNAWQNSAVSIDVLVEAKQHENSAAGWNIVAQENVTVGSINQDAVMGENVITDSSRMMIVYTGGTSVVNPPLQAAEALYGEDLGTVNVVSNSRIYNQLVDSGNYTDVSRDTNMDVVAGVIEGTSTLSTAETIGSSVFYIAAKDNTIIMAPDDVTNLFANLRHIKKIILEKLYFNNTTNMNGMFQNSSSLQQVVFPDVSSGAVAGPGGTIIRPEYSNVTNVNNIFNGCTNIENVDLKEFTNITTANNAFTGCESLKNLDMSSLNYVDITWLKWLFENANELQKIVISAQAEQGIKKESSSDEQASISGVIESVGTLPPVEKVDGTYAQLLTGSEINTKLKNLNSTSPYTKIKFVRDTSIYNQIKTTPDYAELSAQGVSAFMGVIGDTCYVATPSDKIMYAPNDSSNMFAILTWVTDIDLEDLDTSDVTDMSYMFYYCSALTNVNVSSFNTSKVTNMSRMFHYCSSLTSLDLSNFNTSSVTDMFNIFYYCNKLTTIYVSGLWNVNNVTNSNGMFSNCEKIIGQSGKAYDRYTVDKTHANYETGYLTFYNGKSNALVAGPNFNALIPTATTEVYIGNYSTNIPTDGVIDLSIPHDGSIVGFLDGTKFYVTSKNGNIINTCGSMYKMFVSKSNITTIVFDNINTSATFNMSQLFNGCNSMAALDISCFDTSRVTNMSSMFAACKALTQLNLSNFNTSSVTDMNQMFYYCSALTNVNVSSFNTSKVTNMSRMFYYCSNLTSLDLSNFNTSSVTDMFNMFYYCNKLTTIYVSDLWNVNNVTNSNEMFSSCEKIIGQSGKAYDRYNVGKTHANYETGYLTFYNGKSNALVAGPNFNALIPTATTEVYIGNYSTNIPADGVIDLSIPHDGSIIGFLDGTKFYVTSRDGNIINTCGSMYKMFVSKSNITTIVFDNINTSATFNMSQLFNGCNSMATLDISCFDTSRVTNMSSMFAACKNLTELNLSNFNTSNVTDMNQMFYYCSALTNVNVSSFNTSKVTNMSRMFYYCSNLTSLDLSNFNTSSVTDMFNMFYYCNKLTTIYVSDLWNVNNVTNSNEMFSSCEKIIGQSGKAYDKYNVDKTHANYETGYLTYKEAPAA